MDWIKQCISALDAEQLFENLAHRKRFKELLDCYSSYPFFSKGLCKCMYMSSWDEEHFLIMLQMLATMTLEHDKNTDEMRASSDTIVHEQPEEEICIYELANAFLENRPYHLDDTSNIHPEQLHIIKQALRVSEIIDQL